MTYPAVVILAVDDAAYTLDPIGKSTCLPEIAEKWIAPLRDFAAEYPSSRPRRSFISMSNADETARAILVRLPDNGKFHHRIYHHQIDWDDIEICSYAELKVLAKAYLAARKYIELTPCDPDITSDQFEAWKKFTDAYHRQEPVFLNPTQES